MRAAQDRLDDPSSDVAALAATARMSPHTFDRRFRAAASVSALRWLIDQRVLRAQELLAGSGLTVDKVARRCGLSDARPCGPTSGGSSGCHHGTIEDLRGARADLRVLQARPVQTQELPACRGGARRRA